MNVPSPSRQRQIPGVGLAVALVLVAAVGAGRWLRTRAAASTPAQSGEISPSQPATPPVSRGEIVFQLYCAKCHGPEGHGDPDALARQQPPPRDFAARPWRFECSPDSIRRVTADGIPNTAMPAHRAALTEADLQAVVEHTYHLATSGPIVVVERSLLTQHLLAAGFTPESSPRAAPPLSLIDATGRRSTLTDHRGRLVLLNFWGVSCEHCLAGMPKLHSLAEKWQSVGLSVFNICADADDVASASQVAHQVSLATHIWIDETGLANSQYEVQALPTIWLVDKTGNLLARRQGALDWDSPDLARLIEFLTTQPPISVKP